MTTRFAYGKDGIDLQVPEQFQSLVIQGRTAPAIADVTAALEAALDQPIASAPLVELARGKRSAAISVCDITRPAPNAITLPPILARLHRAGIPVEGITLLIATGLHRAATEAEVVRILGPEIASRYRVESHHAKDFAAHAPLGTSSRGTPVFIDKRFLAADLHITLGFVEQHFMLGFSGGRKLIVPGLAAKETIEHIHAPRFIREPMSFEGSIEANPLHAELVEIASMARHDFILDVTLTRERQISGVFAGAPVAAHAAAVQFIRTTGLETVPALADAAITSAAGYPLDLTFYQVLKGISSAQRVVKPGAPILVLGECAEGIGSPEFSAMLATYPGHQQFLDAIRSAPVVVDQWQLEKLALCALRHPVLLYTPRVDPAQLGALGSSWHADLNQAVAALTRSLAAGATIALIPEGPYAFAQGK